MAAHIVIMGATGFIGSAIVRELLIQGNRVTVLLRPDSDLARLSEFEGFASITVSDLLDKEVVNTLKSKNPDIFVNCAWHGVSGNERNNAFQIIYNVPLTISSVELAIATGCKQWIGFGSQAEYGNLNFRINEESPVRPTTVYGKAKLAAGIAAMALCEANGISGVWLRIFSTYGPGDAKHWLMPYVIHELLEGRAPKLTKCEQVWDYLYVKDLATAVCKVANGMTNGIFNLGSGMSRPLRDYIDAIYNETGAALYPEYGVIPYRPDQVMHLEADISRLFAATGWNPVTTLEDGIYETVAFESSNFKGKRTNRFSR